jgi:GT2 family glycosyltransferase
MHSCKNCSRKTFDTINNFINSLYEFCKRDFILYLFDNASDRAFAVPNYENIIYTYIEDQMITGLAGPYNDGIKMAVDDNCDLIILINDDVILNDTINLFIDIIINHPHKDVGLYGPLSNGVISRSPQLSEKAGKGIREITNNNALNINGFLMAFTPQFYNKFKFPNGDFADIRKKWGGGEEILQKRARKGGGRMFIIKDCWVYHKRISDWNKIEKWSRD